MILEELVGATMRKLEYEDSIKLPSINIFNQVEDLNRISYEVDMIMRYQKIRSQIKYQR